MLISNEEYPFLFSGVTHEYYIPVLIFLLIPMLHGDSVQRSFLKLPVNWVKHSRNHYFCALSHLSMSSSPCSVTSTASLCTFLHVPCLSLVCPMSSCVSSRDPILSHMLHCPTIIPSSPETQLWQRLQLSRTLYKGPYVSLSQKERGAAEKQGAKFQPGVQICCS